MKLRPRYRSREVPPRDHVGSWGCRVMQVVYGTQKEMHIYFRIIFSSITCRGDTYKCPETQKLPRHFSFTRNVPDGSINAFHLYHTHRPHHPSLPRLPILIPLISLQAVKSSTIIGSSPANPPSPGSSVIVSFPFPSLPSYHPRSTHSTSNSFARSTNA